MRNNAPKEKIDRLTDWLMSHVNISHIDMFGIRSAVISPNPEFEDSAQIACAENEGCDIFLTSDAGILARDIGTMLVLTPAQFLERMK